MPFEHALSLRVASLNGFIIGIIVVNVAWSSSSSPFLVSSIYHCAHLLDALTSDPPSLSSCDTAIPVPSTQYSVFSKSVPICWMHWPSALPGRDPAIPTPTGPIHWSIWHLQMPTPIFRCWLQSQLDFSPVGKSWGNGLLVNGLSQQHTWISGGHIGFKHLL